MGSGIDYDNIGGVDPSGQRNPWFAPGDYKVRIVKLRDFVSRKQIPFYVIDAELLEVYETEVPEKMIAGRVYSQMIKLQEDMGPINVARFLLAAMGEDPNSPNNKDEIGGPEMIAAIETQFCAGQEMRLTCVLIQTQAGSDFTEHRWHPWQEGEVEAG